MKPRVHKAAQKRIKLVRRKGGRKTRLIHRTAGQGHFNSRESGKVTRSKRRDAELSNSFRKTIQTLIPGINS